MPGWAGIGDSSSTDQETFQGCVVCWHGEGGDEDIGGRVDEGADEGVEVEVGIGIDEEHLGSPVLTLLNKMQVSFEDLFD